MDENTSMEQVEKLQALLGLEDPDSTTLYQLELVLSNTESRLKVLLGGAAEIPDTLQYIVTEVSVARWNRIGSEGMSSHSVEGESISFSDDDFAGYMRDIEAYIDEQNGTKRGRVRFI